MDVDVKVRVTENTPVNGYQEVAVGRGYSSELRGILPMDDADGLEVFISEAIRLAIRLERIENAASKAEAEAEEAAHAAV